MVFNTAKFYLRTLGYIGLLYATKAKIIRSTVSFRLKRNNIKHPILLRIPSSDIKTYNKIFLKNDYVFSVDEEPEVIVDAGANIGLASIYFANIFPEAKIIAIEPDKSNFEILIKNVSPYTKIIPMHAALWNKNEEINLVDPGLGNWGFMTEDKSISDNSIYDFRHTVQSITIDKIMEQHDLDKINILKIDIEGSEKEVFSDTSAWINEVDSIIIELHERRKSGCNRSFYFGTEGFDNEWMQGENVYLTRGEYLKKVPDKV